MGNRKPRKPKVAPPPQRGEVYLVAFDQTVGSEIRKTRPAVILQNDIGNRASSTTIIAAVSSQIHEPPYPVEVVVEPREGGLATRSAVRLDQIRTVDRRRLIRRLGLLRPETIHQVDRAIAISFGLVDF